MRFNCQPCVFAFTVERVQPTSDKTVGVGSRLSSTSTPKKRLLERSKKAATKAATYLAYDTYIIVSYNIQPTALLGVLQNKFSM